VTRTQAGWIVAPAGDWAIAKSAEPIVMAHSYINSDGDRPQNPVAPRRRRGEGANRPDRVIERLFCSLPRKRERGRKLNRLLADARLSLTSRSIAPRTW
jgi:hypothetical protein